MGKAKVRSGRVKASYLSVADAAVANVTGVAVHIGHVEEGVEVEAWEVLSLLFHTLHENMSSNKQLHTGL
jgi:hypothetical protein